MYQYVLFTLSCLAAITMIRAVSPTFDRPTENVTVIIGSSATLPCFISNLGDHKVSWRRDRDGEVKMNFKEW